MYIKAPWLLRLERAPRLVLLSILLGVVGAGAAQLFLWLLETAESWLFQPITGHHFLSVSETSHLTLDVWGIAPLWWVPVATTLGGLLSGVLVYGLAPEAEGHGTDAAIKAYHRLRGKIRPRIPAIKAVASAITIGSGGAAGREGPTAQIAAGIGSVAARTLRLPLEERRYLVAIGVAAGLSAIFKSPLGTAIFAVEVLYSTMAFEAELLVYTIIAAAVAYAITTLVEGPTPLFYLPSTFRFQHAGELAWYLLLGLVSGGVGALIPTVFYRARDAFAALPVPRHIKPAIGGLMLGVMGITLPQLLGGGYGWMQLAIDGRLPVALMLILALGKLLALSLTISSGGSGGVFAPSLYVGAMVGASLSALLSALTPIAPDPAAFAVVGMAATFAGAARVPVASMIMIAEMTGGYELIMPAMLSVALSFLVQIGLTRRARYPSLYEAQVGRFVDSPAHHGEFSQALRDFLAREHLRLDEGLVRLTLNQRLSRGVSVPIGGGGRLYSAVVAEDSPVAGRDLLSIDFPDELLVVEVHRDDIAMIPHGDVVLQPGDRLLIAATDSAMQSAGPMLHHASPSPQPTPQTAGDD